MADEYVTRAEFIELRKEMNEGFTELKEQLGQIQKQLEINPLTDQQKYDSRYCLQSNAMQDAVSRVSCPEFRRACYPIIPEWLDTEDGKLKLGCVIDRHFDGKRDSASKWMNFIKLIAGIILAAGIIHGGSTVYKQNQQMQKAIIEYMQRGE